jgi:DNA-binding response OmpR family regulator
VETVRSQIKVLVVDDSNVIRHALKSFFEEYRLEVITCDDGMEGIQKAIEHKPDIIFLDLMMPNVDGVKMLQIIKMIDTLKTIPIIIISGNTNKTNVLTVIEAGADRIISKPLKKEVIVKNMVELLGKEKVGFLEQNNKFNEIETNELVSQLRKHFLNSFVQKRRFLINGLETKNEDLVKAVAHEIKGAGGSIRYPLLTDIGEEIETMISSGNTDWDTIKEKCNQIFSIVNEMQNYGSN